jgi:integrase
VLQPVLLRPHPSGESGVYELVVGSRRFRASKLARRETIPATIRELTARNAELTRLKFSDADSKRMVIHIQGGKGRKDRDVMLSPKLLKELREHWQRLRRKPRLLRPTPAGSSHQASSKPWGWSHLRSL